MITLQAGNSMKFESKKKIHDLEKQLQEGYKLPIFRGYVAVNKRGVEQIIDSIYKNLPNDVQTARGFLKSWKEEPILKQDTESKNNLFDYLQKLETTLNEQVSFASYVIVKVKEIEDIINQIYKNIPSEINEVENLDR